MKNHKRVNGQLLQTNKTFRQLKQKQKIKINDWMFEAYLEQYHKTGRVPGLQEDFEIVSKVLQKIEEAQIWIPDYEIDEQYDKVKEKLKKRLDKEIIREKSKEIYLEILAPLFSVCKVADYSGIDLDQPYCFIGTSESQKSLICPTSMVITNTISRSDGWNMICIRADKSPIRVKIMSRISEVFRKWDIDSLYISTFDLDFVLVRNVFLDKSVEALKNVGFRFQ